jgi:uncharacterized protein (TIGR02687 family)
MDRITEAIKRKFKRHRVVFWYDTKQEFREEFETLELPEVEKIELGDNEYGVKYRVLREKPDQNFLLYHDGPKPDYLDNWLLDVLLAHDEFRADRVSLWLTELELGPEFWNLVQEHEAFCQAKARREALKQRLEKGDSHNVVRMKMLAVCVNSDTDARLEDILEQLLQEYAQDRDEKIRLIERSALDDFLWKQMEQRFEYVSETPGIFDFAIELFKSSYALSLDEDALLSKDALVFLKRWKDSSKHQPTFEHLSHQVSEILGIEGNLQSRDTEALIEIDYFKLVDQKILSDLAYRVVERTISAGDYANLIWRRRTTHWYREFSDIYEAIYFGSQFIAQLELADLKVQSLSEGLQKYTNTWYQLDQLYRKFIFHARASKQVSLLQELINQIENLYSNRFLLKVNDNWQQVVDACETWDARPFMLQREFFDRCVGSYLRGDVKVAVVISDALRYEIGEEFMGRIKSEDRYIAEMETMLAMLPSYTQLGMASLLPNESVAIQENGSVEVDGESTVGTDNRAKILCRAVPEGATAIRAENLMGMNIDESRALIREHQVVYIYHNQIDATGDKRETEERVFDAAESALRELIDIVKKLANANLSNILVTADHGFIYQHRAIDESEFSGIDVHGDDITYRDRRFVIGHGLRPNDSVKSFMPSQLGLIGDYQIFIPKSINRLRLSGAGSRYVHGGASLQEVVLPVIKINKKRVSDVVQVDVDILRGASNTITSGQFSVACYQVEPVSPKVQPRSLRAGIYTMSGDLISDQHELVFDLASEDPREREVPVQFILTREADSVNNQEVLLKLEELVPGTSHYREYKTVRYMVRRSFTTDFDF